MDGLGRARGKNWKPWSLLLIYFKVWVGRPTFDKWHSGKSLLKRKKVDSQSVMSSSLWPHGLRHARLPCPSPTPGVHSNSCPLSWWCHPTISSSVVPFSSRLQFSPALGSFPMSQFFASGGQSIGASASASDLPMDHMDHGILQARILEWVAIPFSRGSSQPRDRTQVSHTAGGFFTSWMTGESLLKGKQMQTHRI